MKSKSQILLKNNEISTYALSLEARFFTYQNLKKQPKMFKYLCGLTVEMFDMLFELVQPYVCVIQYPDCSGTGDRSIEKVTELLAFLTICRHGLHLGVMSYMLSRSNSTVYRIFVGWVTFLEFVFSQVNLKPDHGFLIKNMPEIFIQTGHGLTDIVIDCTEFKFDHASNFELNSLMFSNYKNTQTGKALIGISPHGSGLYFSEIYPGSISDSVMGCTRALNNVRQRLLYPRVLFIQRRLFEPTCTKKRNSI